MHEATATPTAESPGLQGDARGLIALFLAEQADLSAVDRFAQFHEDVEEPLRAGLYQSLLPAAPPGAGQQYAFEVDLDRCSGCKACVAACHALNGLDEHEAWRDVGLVVGRGASGLPVIQHVTSSCHHCIEPACLTACPVDAYEKDPITGIVRHLDDQCFGCQYCALVCPYDAPKFHPAKGIVRKCDMCADRLAVGEAPACVQACPHEAIRIRVVDCAETIDRAHAGVFLPTAPDPSFTLPTTRYVSDRVLGAGIRPAHDAGDVPEHIPASLVLMLVLTQAAAGAFGMDLLVRPSGLANGSMRVTLQVVGLLLAQLGIVASLFHLGRPQFAYRALIGLRHSWLSREIAAFGIFSALATAHTALAAIRGSSWGGLPAILLSAATAGTGFVAVICSAMVYHVTRRPFWNVRAALGRFAGSVLLLGPLALLVASASSPDRQIGIAAALVAAAAAGVKLRWESGLLRPFDDDERTLAARSAWLMKVPLAGLWRTRRALGFAGGFALPILWMGLGPPMIPAAGQAVAILALAAAIAGELAERCLFFAAVIRPRMPGELSSC